MENILTCSHCGNEILSGESTFTVHGDIICEACADEETIICDRCNERIWEDEDEGDEYVHLCADCYNDHYTRCDECGAVIHNDCTYYDDDDDNTYCENCYHNRNTSIRPYDYRPEPVFHGNGSRFFGVELEIDSGGKLNDKADIILDIGNLSENNICIKSDGSLNDGMEIVTHPMSLDYHKNDMPWLAVMKKAVELHYLSHKTRTCGLHIHVNRSTFGETREIQDECISRVLYFVEHHWEEMLKFSRRTESQMDRWAARYGYKNIPKELIEHAKKSSIGRYSCVNITNFSTIEFRMFRGTLKRNSLIAALEFVNIICDFAVGFTDEEIKAIGWTEFVEKIDTDENPELITYLKERMLYVNDPVIYEEDD